MARNKMNFIILAIYLLVMILITILQLFVVLFYPVVLTDESIYTTFSSIVNLLLYVSLFVIFVLVFKKYFIEKLKDFKSNYIKYLIIIILGFFTMIVASYLSAFIMEYLGVTETSENQEQLNQLLEGTLFDKIALFAFAVLFVPLVEEFVFRKAILDLFHFKVKDRNGTESSKYTKLALAVLAILVSSFAFGFIHVMSGDFVQIIYYAALGAVLGTVYMLSNKNIYVPIVMHFLLNFMVTTILFLGL